ITRDLSGVTTLFPLTRSITALKTPPKGVNVQVLARTSPESWGETNRADLQRGIAKPDPQDLKGPLAVAAVATIDKARIVVYGTSNLAANQFLNIQGNRDFFLNTVSWLAEEEDQISVRPKDTKQTPVFMSSNQAQAVNLLPMLVLPGIGLIGGIIAVVCGRAGKSSGRRCAGRPPQSWPSSSSRSAHSTTSTRSGWAPSARRPRGARAASSRSSRPTSLTSSSSGPIPPSSSSARATAGRS